MLVSSWHAEVICEVVAGDACTRAVLNTSVKLLHSTVQVMVVEVLWHSCEQLAYKRWCCEADVGVNTSTELITQGLERCFIKLLLLGLQPGFPVLSRQQPHHATQQTQWQIGCAACAVLPCAVLRMLVNLWHW